MANYEDTNRPRPMPETELVVVDDSIKRTLAVNWTLVYDANQPRDLKRGDVGSKPFVASFYPTLSWRLRLIRANPSRYEAPWFDVYLYTLSKQGELEFDISANVSVMDDQNRALVSQAMNSMVNSKSLGLEANYVLRCPWFQDDPYVYEFLNESVINLRVAIKYTRRILGFESILERMSSYKQFIDNPANSDFTILLDDGKKIGVNKTAMLIQWPHFKLMIDATQVATKSSVLLVSFVEYDGMKALVEFVLTGLTEFRDVEFAMKLISAAHRCKVQDLIDNCIKFIGKRLSTNHVLDALVLADTLELSELTEICLDLLSVEKETNGQLSFESFPGYSKFDAYKNHYEIVLKIAEKV